MPQHFWKWILVAFVVAFLLALALGRMPQGQPLRPSIPTHGMPSEAYHASDGCFREGCKSI